ncbi:unnamed protein product [Didymodactylos carnosus]|uniref:Nuclear receptor domain-containing protein n=1 Tax=Didymodactylos carnosus TaxID=1234261 RepID=A0A814HT22_9BILA|nr:unnamed protein product [Didymodactylos carnosus]CAF1322194.1 unnamed protein product [Didymodactylos carnosus]CAF3785723.1 unnamed protein product [Didymodactylos carnosus]CAF4132618.1 unnamed protein product [Didymodactylos carnosus]
MSTYSEIDDDQFCQICTDKASGWHCGAITCEACKKFFLRTINAENKYKCQHDKCCIINRHSRTQCQYCRYQKCLKFGMKPNNEKTYTKTEDLYKTLPCIICSSSSSGLHFGAITCEACKCFFRRSIKENAIEHYHCSANDCCKIDSKLKMNCRACRFRKCIDGGMSVGASRIGRQSNLFKHSLITIQEKRPDSKMASIDDSARVAIIAKKRKIKYVRSFSSPNEIAIKLPEEMKIYIENVRIAYCNHLKELPYCLPRETVWLTIGHQLVLYAECLIHFCQKTITNFNNLSDPYEIISSSIHTVIIITLMLTSRPKNKLIIGWNYWKTDKTLADVLYSYIPYMSEAENFYRSNETELRNFQFDENEISLVILICLTRINFLNSDKNSTWSKCQFDCVEALSEYMQARRGICDQLPFEFYDVSFLITQIRSLNKNIVQCLTTAPWPKNLPFYFYRIYVPNIEKKQINSNEVTDQDTTISI